MDPELQQRLVQFVKPLYQDLDAVSRFDDVERVSAIARQVYSPPDPESVHHFELLLLFQGLRSWLERVGNVSRAVLMIGGGVSETDLRRVTDSLRRLESPVSDAEKALAAAILIDEAGVRGLMSRFAEARRTGSTAIEVAHQILATPPSLPDWMPREALRWAAERLETRRLVCEQFVKEARLEDLSS